MKSSNAIFGAGLIIIGLVFLLENFGFIEFAFESVWPFFLIIGGVAFWAGYFTDRKNIGLIMPGTILTIYGGLFLYCSLYGWYHMETAWPLFMIGPGIGFFLMYLLGTREAGLLIPAGILTGIGILFAFRHAGYVRYWPALLIILGIIIVIRHRMEKKEKQYEG